MQPSLYSITLNRSSVKGKKTFFSEPLKITNAYNISKTHRNKQIKKVPPKFAVEVKFTKTALKSFQLRQSLFVNCVKRRLSLYKKPRKTSVSKNL
jgi:hypothetical protein